MFDHPLGAIRAFVAGHITPAEFRAHMESDPQAFEAFLSDDPHLDPANYVGGNVYRFLVQEDLDSLGGALNAQGALADFLERSGRNCARTSRYSDLYDLILSAQPEWLGVDPDYIHARILPEAEGRSGGELREWLRSELTARFKYESEKPPDWIREPCWPIGENGPLVFLGQIDVSQRFHDYGTVYVFYDFEAGTFENVLQTF
jgi:hypothetical protein